MRKLKISIRELLLLILMMGCFIATIIFLLLQNTGFALVTFALHSCLVIVLILIYNEQITYDLETGDFTQPPSDDIILEYTEEIARLNREAAVIQSEKEKLQARIAALEEGRVCDDSASEGNDDSAGSRLSGMLLPEHEEPITLDLIKACTAVMDEMRTDCQKSGISLVLSTDCEELFVKADASFIRIMFRNIIDNSVKYMQRNGSLVVTISNIGEDLFIVLKDNGVGLSLAETEHIFELNYQGSNRISGNGLGLTQAKAIVDYYGGTIYAKSGSGKGMAIYIQLPTANESEESDEA